MNDNGQYIFNSNKKKKKISNYQIENLKKANIISNEILFIFLFFEN